MESEICSPFARAAGGLTCDNSPICSVKAKEIRRDLLKMDREFVCDTCYRGYSHRRNLTRHIQEKHWDISYYPCTEYLCRGRFMRRGFLVTQLRKSHNIDRDKAERLSRRVERVRKQDSYVLFQYHSDISDISDDESCFDKLSSQGNSLEKVLAENDRQNSNIVQELCDSLKTFTDNSDNSLYSAVRPVPMNDFEITSQELFDFNVDELAMEVEMEKIRRDGTGFVDDSIVVNNVNVDENTCSVIPMKDVDENMDVNAMGTNDDDKYVTATGTSDDDYDVAAIGTSDDNKDVTATGTSDDDKDVTAIGTSDDDKDVTATGTSDDDYDVAAIGTSDDDKDVTATGTSDDDKDVTATGISDGIRDENVTEKYDEKVDEIVMGTTDENVDENNNVGGSIKLSDKCDENSDAKFGSNGGDDTEKDTESDWRDFDELNYSEMTDDSVNYDDDNDDGDNEDDVQEDNNDSNEDEVIVIDSFLICII